MLILFRGFMKAAPMLFCTSSEVSSFLWVRILSKLYVQTIKVIEKVSYFLLALDASIHYML
jgi:hypothetical protein